MSQWRSRAFYLTRKREFLVKVTAAILGVFGLLAVAVHVARGKPSGRNLSDLLKSSGMDLNNPSGKSMLSLLQQNESFREGYQSLLSSNKREPAKLAAWLKLMAVWASLLQGDGVPAEFQTTVMRLEELKLDDLFRKHSESEPQRSAFASFARYHLSPDAGIRDAAFQELEKLAFSADSPRHANELLADALTSSGRTQDALKALLRESRNIDAWEARKDAVDLAIDLKDADVLNQLLEDSALIKRLHPGSLWEAAKITRDGRLLLRALWRSQWQRWMQTFAVPLTLLAAAIWYVILVYTASGERFRWLRYLPAVFAGVVSVLLLYWLQGTLQYALPDDAGAPTPTQEMLDWVLNVGLPEEFAKLLLFSFFLPVLLHRRSSVKAALTAGCVGLGFALDENLGYFAGYGSSAALGRLLTANFLHISLTGILGWSLYELFRSKFHKATEFLTAFLAVVAAHGLYDFSAGPTVQNWGLDMMSIVILVVAARFYLHLLSAPAHKPAGWVVSRTALFLFGLALLIGILMVVATWQQRSLNGIVTTLQSALGLAVVAYFYVREFNEV